jgi:hypothetical protein
MPGISKGPAEMLSGTGRASGEAAKAASLVSRFLACSMCSVLWCHCQNLIVGAPIAWVVALLGPQIDDGLDAVLVDQAITVCLRCFICQYSACRLTYQEDLERCRTWSSRSEQPPLLQDSAQKGISTCPTNMESNR